MQISFKKIESEAEFEGIKNLYLTAFPTNERREFDELKKQICNDDLSCRRIRFYEQNGFHKLNRTYIQPSYGGNKPEVELKLMSTNVDFPSETLDKYILKIREKVYRDIS